MSLTPECSERAHLLADKVVLGLCRDGDEAMHLAADLLMAGFEGPAVIDLAGISRGTRWADAAPKVEAALAEIGVRLPEEGDAGWSVALYWARRLQAGGLGFERFARSLWGLWWALGKPTEVSELAIALDELEGTILAERYRLEPQFRALAGPIIRLAEKRLRQAF